MAINQYQPAKAPPCVPGRYNIVVNVLSKQSQAQLRSRAWSCRHFTAGGSGGEDPHEILGVVVVQCKLHGILSEMFWCSLWCFLLVRLHSQRELEWMYMNVRVSTHAARDFGCPTPKISTSFDLNRWSNLVWVRHDFEKRWAGCRAATRRDEEGPTHSAMASWNQLSMYCLPVYGWYL